MIEELFLSVSNGITPGLLKKAERLAEILRGMERVLIGYSGGVDSTFLLFAAHRVLGEGAAGVLVRSPLHPGWETADALETARIMGITVELVEMDELFREEIASNPPDRCYHCKGLRFGALMEAARDRGIPFVLDGTNADDRGDYRPGMKALARLGVRSPMEDAGLSKGEIRELSKCLGLPTWNRPSLSCLATRIPYGTRLERDALKRVEAGEDLLRGLGFFPCRVRLYGGMARLEVAPERLQELAGEGMRGEVVRGMRALGFDYVTLDMEGYSSGSMNRVLDRRIEIGQGQD